MITDENGQKWPETVEEAAKLKHIEESANRFFERKAQREGWAKPELNQGMKPKVEKTSADLFFERKARKEGRTNK